MNATVLLMTKEEADRLNVKYLTKDTYVVKESAYSNVVSVHRIDGMAMPALVQQLNNLRGRKQDTDRCWNCEHQTSFHQDDGCWFTLTEGVLNYPLNCTCALSNELSSSREID